MNETAKPKVLSEQDAEDLISKSHHDLVVLPSYVAADGLACYDDALLDVVKELKVEGVDAAYAHDSASRSWIGRKGFTPVAVSFIVGVGSSAAWDALLHLLFRRKPESPMTAKIARCVATEHKTRWEWFEFTGTGEDIAKAMSQVEVQSPPHD